MFGFPNFQHNDVKVSNFPKRDFYEFIVDPAVFNCFNQAFFGGEIPKDEVKVVWYIRQKEGDYAEFVKAGVRKHREEEEAIDYDYSDSDGGSSEDKERYHLVLNGLDHKYHVLYMYCQERCGNTNEGLLILMLHEMIHAYLVLKVPCDKYADAHDAQFMSETFRVGRLAGVKITTNANPNVSTLSKGRYVWKCSGKCSKIKTTKQNKKPPKEKHSGKHCKSDWIFQAADTEDDINVREMTKTEAAKDTRHWNARYVQTVYRYISKQLSDDWDFPT